MDRHRVGRVSVNTGIFFFYVVQLEIYPKEWKKGYINPIFKAGERFDHYNELFRQTF